MGKVIALTLIGMFLAGGCSSPRVNRFETTAYQLASPENKLKIEQGTIAVGMSIEECRVSCTECQFIKKFSSSSNSTNNYELWEVKDSQGRDLYLHVVSGRIEKVSTENQKPPEKKIRAKKK